MSDKPKMDENHLLLDMEKIRDVIPNKYEFIVITMRYAHVISKQAARQNIYLRRKPFLIAAEAVLQGKVKYHKSG